MGAGPGDPELLTLRAARLLARADVVAHDELVSDEVLALAERAELVPVGRRANGARHHEGRLHPVVVERALAGAQVVRLKGGDGYVFGRGGEEAEELALAGVPFEVVPGITAAFGAAASARIPLTHREVARSVTLATAHAAGDVSPEQLARSLPREGTIAAYMGLGRLEALASALVATGRSAETPAAVISRATLPDERVVVATLGTLAVAAAAARLEPPALVLVGEVVALRVPEAASPPQLVHARAHAGA